MQTLSSPRPPATVPASIGRQHRLRAGLTLVELLVTISIIAILASIFLGALQLATEDAKAMKTKSMIVKLNNLIMPRYEAYRTRRVPLNISAFTTNTTTKQTAATTIASASSQRLNGLYELMRFELPEAWTDITDTPMYVVRPALSQAYLNAYLANNSLNTAAFPTYQNAETLYMIVTLGFVDQLGGRDLFNESNVADTDQDGFPEFVDAWGTPIRFLRWAPGFTTSELNGVGGQLSNANPGAVYIQDVQTFGMSKVSNVYAGKTVNFYSVSGNVMQSTTIFSSVYSAGMTTLYLDSTEGNWTIQPAAGDYFGIDPDPFNPMNLDMNQNASVAQTTHVGFAIYPLIYSAGPDRVYSIVSENGLQNGNVNGTTGGPSPTPTSFDTVDPFWSIGNPSYTSGPVGWTADIGPSVNGPGESGTSGWFQGMNGWLDNIHNHMIGTR